MRDAAVAHLARYAATRARLIRVLDRRIERWERAADGPDAADQAAAARRAARAVVEALATAGALDDAAFAATRARRLVRAGRSRRAMRAHLAAHGVAAEDARAAVADAAPSDLAAGLLLARRRRLGPFRPGAAPPDEAALRRELAVFGRAGFPREVAEQVLAMPAADAEALVDRLRRS